MVLICVESEYDDTKAQEEKFEWYHLAYDLCGYDYENEKEEIDEKTSCPNEVKNS